LTPKEVFFKLSSTKMKKPPNEGTVIRKLGAFELAQTLSDEYFPFNAVGVLRLSNGPDPDSLRKALGILQSRHPLLRANIKKTDQNYYYHIDETDGIPLKLYPRKGESFWKKEVEEQLNSPLYTASGPLIRYTYLYSESPGAECEIINTHHHSIVDAVSVYNMFHEMLSLLGAIQMGSNLDDYTPLPLLSPEDFFFPPKFKGFTGKLRTAGFMMRQISDEFSYRLGMRGKRKAAVHPTARCHILPVVLPANVTRNLIRRTRRHRITINSALNAAIVLATHRVLYDGQTMPFRYITFADLRPYLKPPVSNNHTGTYHSVMRFTIPVGKNKNFWEFAASINNQIFKSVKRGDKFISALMSPMMMRTHIGQQSWRMGNTAISYPGVAGIEPQYGQTRVNAIHGFVSNFPIGPEYTGSARIFENKLWMDFVYLDSDMDHTLALTIADKIRTIIETETNAIQ
jgi:hypothetical protein